MPNLVEIFREFMRLDAQRRRDGLSVQELKRWEFCKRSLGKHFQPDLADDHDERRDSIRVPIEVKVSFECHGEACESLMTNVSRGGVFIATPDPPPIGSPIKLRLTVEDSGEEIELNGKVVAHNTGTDMVDRQRGMGIHFVNLLPSQQTIVDDLYRRAMHGALRKKLD